MKEINELRDLHNHYYNELENGNWDVEEQVYELENKINELLDEYSYQNEYDYNGSQKEFRALNKLRREVKTLKKDFDFYDAEAELNMMFPDRHDEDFDEDSMSYDSVFGND